VKQCNKWLPTRACVVAAYMYQGCRCTWQK